MLWVGQAHVTPLSIWVVIGIMVERYNGFSLPRDLARPGYQRVM